TRLELSTLHSNRQTHNLVCFLPWSARYVCQRAARVLELDRGVVNIEAFAKKAIDIVQNRIALGRRHIFDQHVAAQRARLRTEPPDVQIVNVDHASNAANLLDDLRQLESLGQTLEQNIE